MKLIVGLGNPGKVYAQSRHNIGFLVISSLAQDYKVVPRKDTFTFSFTTRIKVAGENIILAMPLSFMNLSGIAVKVLLKKYKISPSNLLVVCDDLDLEFGRIKLRPGGSSGGHNGLCSVIDSLGRQDFCRLRIGIDRPQRNIQSAEYVLAHFAKKEKEALGEIIERAVECCQVWIRDGIEKAMTRFNRKEAK